MTGNRRFVGLVVVLSAVGVMGFSVVAPALPDLAVALSVDDAAIGWVQGAVSLPGAFLSILLGWLADRYGRKPILLIALLLFGVSGTAAAFADTFPQLILLRVVQGAGGGALLGLPMVLIGDLFAGRERVRVMGLNLASITAAAAISPLIGGALAEGDPFRPFFIYAIAFPLIPVTLQLPADTRRNPEPPLRHLTASVRSMRDSGTLADVIAAQPAAMVAVLVFGGIVFVGTPLHLASTFGVGPAVRGAVIAVASATAAATSLRLDRLVARLGNGTLFTLSALSITVGLAVMALPAGLWAIPTGLVAVGFSLGTIFPLLQVLVASAVSDEFRGTVVGLYATTVRGGQTLGPAAASALFAAVGGRMMYTIGAVLTLVLTLMWRPVRAAAQRAVTCERYPRAAG